MSDGGPPGDPKQWPRWLLTTDNPRVSLVRETVSSILLVLLLGVALFGVSGVWPPMVAVESGSMEPHMERGDLVFVMEASRFPPDAATPGTGVVSFKTGETAGYQKFGDYGDVIVFEPDATSTPIIHRARFWVNDSENWYEKANPSYVQGESCQAVSSCPAPHAGFITKGDNNQQYDQATGIADPVRPQWIRGTAEVRIPWLGHIRLAMSRIGVQSVDRSFPVELS